MAHQVESMLYVGQTPWHNLGVRLASPPTAEDAIRLSGLDWEVGLKGLLTVDGESVDHRATYRMTDGKILGVVGPGWFPIQNKDAFAWFDPFLEAREADIECAGSLKGGRRVWVLAKLARDPSVIVPGDEIQKYILLANSHDGTLAARVGFTPVRVVCNNTLSMAVHGNESQLVKVRHTKGASATLEDVRELMNVADAAFEATAEQYRALARKSVDKADLEKYVKLVFKRQPSAKEKAHEAAMGTAAAESSGSALLGGLLDRPLRERESDDSFAKQERSSRQFDIISEFFESGQGNTLPDVKGTYWAAYNAVTEYTTHHRGRSEENRLAAQFGEGQAINRRALSTALALSS